MDLLAGEVADFKRRTRKSERIWREASKYTPFGVHSNYRAVDPYPLYVQRARGTSLWDADGNRYLDFNMAFGALVCGHAHPAIVRAMRERVASGTIFGFESTDIPQLNKVLCERFRIDRVKLSNSGLESTLFAVRVARAFTGRRKVLKFEGCYHGSHDALLVSVKPPPEKEGDRRRPNPVLGSKGLLPALTEHTIVAPFNDLEAAEGIAMGHADDLAAVILEPVPMNMGFVLPRPGFLEGLRRVCDTIGALLVFDEVKTSGKWFGGAEEAFGVRPDLKVLGKAIGGGFPIAATGGRRDIMASVVPGQVSHAGTFNSNPASVTAALTALTKVLTTAGMRKAQRLGDRLGKGCADIAADRRLPVAVNYRGISGTIHFTHEPVVDWRSFQRTDVGKWWGYFTAMLNRGVIPMATGPDEQWTLSVQHTAEDVDRHLGVFDTVAERIAAFEAPMGMVEAI